MAGADGAKFTAVGGALTFKAKPDFEMATDANGDNVYEVTVVATAGGKAGMRAVKVTVENANEAGVVSLNRTQPRVGIPVTASLTDPDGSISGLTWQWSADGGADIEDATSDTYTPTAEDVTNTVTLVATASYTDGHGAEKTAVGTAAIAVAADTRNKAPVFGDEDSDTDGVQNSMATRKVEENTEADASDDPAAESDVPGDNVGGPVMATDPDPNADPLTYTLSGADAGSFRVRDNGQIEVGAGTELDYEMKQTYMVTVTAEDSFGATASIPVTIMVTDMDEAPEIMRAPDANVAPKFASATTSRTVAENTAAGEDIGNPVAATDNNGDTLTYAPLGGTDAASFDIGSATGQLMTKAALDYEAKASYEVTVTATDPEGASDMITVTITVTNEDDMGRVTFWRDGADATTAAIVVGDMLGGLAEDPDGNVGDTPPITDMYPNITGATWQWAKTMTPDMVDSWMDITGATAAAYMVMDADEGYHLRATAMYDDGEGMGKMASEETMMVTMNAAPMFESEADTREVAENTVAGEDIGNPVAASDANDDALTYTLGGADVASFAIDSDTGQLMTLAALDHETKATYSVTVTASDSGGLSDSIDVTITVTDVDEDVAPADPLKDKYDANDNDEIERSEVFAAINDYLDGNAGAPTRADVFKLIELYLGD